MKRCGKQINMNQRLFDHDQVFTFFCHHEKNHLTPHEANIEGWEKDPKDIEHGKIQWGKKWRWLNKEIMDK